MKRLLRKAVLLLLPCGLTLAAWTASQPRTADADSFCTDRQGRLCFTEGQQIQCSYLGCCLTIWDGSCVCEEGRWNCGEFGVPRECPQPGDPDYFC
jgi:hypothetical protein